MRFSKFAWLLVGTALAVGLTVGAQAAPITYSRAAVDAATDGFIVKAVTRVGVAHRSVRRTTRRVVRRHY
jgi:hypothetical protein